MEPQRATIGCKGPSPGRTEPSGCQAVAVDIGRIGVWTSYRPFGAERAGEAAALVEQLGYGAWWVGGSPRVPDLRPILEATSTLVAATGILNVWSNDPAETAAADAALRAEFPGRLMLGIGIGHPEATSDYGRPLRAMRAFLDGLDASPTPPPGGRALPGRARPEDARPRRRAHGGNAHVLRDRRAHAARARATRPGRARGPRGGLRRRDGPGARPGRRARVREAVPRAEQLHAPAARRGLHRGRPRRRRLRPADRRRHPPWRRPGGSPRPSTRTSTRAPTTCACSRWARRASRARRGRRSRRP